MANDDDELKTKPVRTALKPFLAGMATVIPLLATGWIVILVFRYLHKVGLFIINSILAFLNGIRRVSPSSEEAWSMEGFPGDDLLWLLIPLALLFLVGLAVTNRPGRRVAHWLDGTIKKVPIVGFIYSSFKQVVDAIRDLSGPRKFKGVAYIEYPSPGCRLIGFITGSFIDPQTKKGTTSVFIPTAPNPISGFVVLIDSERVHRSSMTLEEGTKMVISAGLVAPAAFLRPDPIHQDQAEPSTVGGSSPETPTGAESRF